MGGITDINISVLVLYIGFKCFVSVAVTVAVTILYEIGGLNVTIDWIKMWYFVKIKIFIFSVVAMGVGGL